MSENMNEFNEYPDFDPGPDRERIHEDDMPSEEELPEILKFLEQAGQELNDG